jgi:signal transduction histidine kinase
MPGRQDKSSLHVNRLTVLLTVGASLLVVACIAVILWVLGVATGSVDRAQRDGERRLLHSYLAATRQTLADGVKDYATWTELYGDFMRAQNAEWEAENLGPYIATTFGIDYVFVTAKDGNIAYAYAKKGGPVRALSRADTGMLSALTRQIFAADAERSGSQACGFVKFAGTASLVSAALIRPTSVVEQRKQAEPRYALVEIRSLDAAFLAKVGRDYGVRGLRVVPSAKEGVVLQGPADTASGLVLTWTPSTLGHRLFLRVLPAVLFIGGMLLLAFLLLLTFWWRVVDHIRAGQTLVLNAEVETARARAVAAEETAKSKSAFIANMSHELRTPLNAIIGFSEFMRCEMLGPVDNPKYREYVAMINDSGIHLLHIINDILLVSKVEAGKFEPCIENVPLSEVVGETVRMLEIVAGKRRIALNVTLSSGPVMVRADMHSLRQILINIINNAIKFSPDGSAIEIACGDPGEDGRVALRVADHGCGIPKETLRDLGKPFVQAEQAYCRKYEGTGLGIAICYRLAAAMDASIEVSSEVGAGTTVEILLMAVRPETAEAASASVAAA